MYLRETISKESRNQKAVDHTKIITNWVRKRWKWNEFGQRFESYNLVYKFRAGHTGNSACGNGNDPEGYGCNDNGAGIF